MIAGLSRLHFSLEKRESHDQTVQGCHFLKFNLFREIQQDTEAPSEREDYRINSLVNLFNICCSTFQRNITGKLANKSHTIILK